MKKILKNCFSLIMYVFLALYVILLRYSANDSKIFYCVGLIIGAVFIAIVPFLFNNCKKIEVRRAYLACIVLESIFLTGMTLSYIFDDVITIYYWIVRFLLAGSIATLIFQVFYSVKDWFKKGYSFEKFDYQAIQMFLNSCVYLLIITVLTSEDIGAPEILIDKITFATTYLFDFDIVAKWMIYISITYLIFSIILEIIIYNKYLKNEPK